MAISIKHLRALGYSDQDIDIAKRHQEQQRRVGVKVDSLRSILSGVPAPNRSPKPEDLTERQLARRGRYGQAALLLDQQALQEADPDRAAKARHASALAKELAEKPKQLEFNFFGGNWSVGNEYWDAISDRIGALAQSQARRTAAFAVLGQVLRHLRWGTSEADVTAAAMARTLRMQPADVSRALHVLEEVGAVHRLRRGRTKIIHVNPEGAYRGKVDQHHHASAVERFAVDVLGRPNRCPPDNDCCLRDNDQSPEAAGRLRR